MKTIANNQFAPLYEGVEFYHVSETDKRAASLKEEGKNLKRILILTEGELSSEEKALSMKILSALGLITDDVVLVSMTEKNYPSFSYLKSNFNFEKLIGFGVAPQMISVNVEAALNKVFTVQETAMLFTHSLKALAGDTTKKDALWKSLKKMFGLKNV